MKVILTGCTGFVGNEVLDQCLQDPSITSVIALSRRELPSSITHPKLTVRIIDDFMTYGEPLMNDLEGADACIWALGKAVMSDMKMARKLHVDYTLAALRTFDKAARMPAGKKFRFVYCSGRAAERDQDKSLWLLGEYRQIRGEVENVLVSYAKEHSDTVETYVVRPGMILSKEPGLAGLLGGLFPSIKVDVLSRKMIDIALQGSEDQILENEMMKA